MFCLLLIFFFVMIKPKNKLLCILRYRYIHVYKFILFIHLSYQGHSECSLYYINLQYTQYISYNPNIKCVSIDVRK